MRAAALMTVENMQFYAIIRHKKRATRLYTNFADNSIKIMPREAVRTMM